VEEDTAIVFILLPFALSQTHGTRLVRVS